MMTDLNEADHPYVIKMPEEPPTSEYGLGYEIFQSMKQNSENIAQYILETDNSQTFAELMEECIKVAVNLKAENLSEEDVVGLCLDNHEHCVVPYSAALFLGVKVLPMNNNLVNVEEQANILRIVKPRIIFVDDNILQDVEKITKLAELDAKLVILGDKSNRHSSYSDFLVASKSDIETFQPVKLNSNKGTAVIISSSGTSGAIKAICLSHHTLLTRTQGSFFPLCILLAKIFWVTHFIAAFGNIRSGTARVIMRESDQTNIWRVVEKYKVVYIIGSVYKINALLKHIKPNDADISSLKLIACGGMVIPIPTIRKLKEIVPGLIVLPLYGQTEIGGLAIRYSLQKQQEREWLVTKPKSCGKPIEGMWCKVVDPETEEILGPNKQGELRIKSNLTMLGFYNRDSSDAFDSAGWLKTGDIFEYDDDRCFYMIERMKELIRSVKGDIIPTVTEHILMEHPMVEDAAVIGVLQEDGYDVPMGIVTLKKECDIDPKQLEEYVNQRVSDQHMLAAGVKIIPKMPMTGTGKILKRVLRKRIATGEI